MSEGLDEGDSEGPNIGGCGRGGIRGSELFRGVVDVAIAMKFAGLSKGKNSVGGEFELVDDGQKIGGLHMGVSKALAVKIDEAFDQGIEHFAGFLRSQRALRQELREVFVGALHDDI